MADRLALRRISPGEAGTGSSRLPAAADSVFLEQVAAICREVASGGDTALVSCIERFDGGTDGLRWYSPADFAAALAGLDAELVSALEAAVGRVRRFAQAQKAALSALSVAVPGGQAGHDILPLERVGCYVPGGRYPLPSSAIMTVVPARVAGVGEVLVVCPKPDATVLAACALAGADRLLAAGGAHAIAALAYGTESVPACDAIVGPGNRWVAAAKNLVRGMVRTDAMAGPSELLVLADDSASADMVAADLLAQAEHDPDARVMLAATSENIVRSVECSLNRLAAGLPTLDVIKKSLSNAWAAVAGGGTGGYAALASVANRVAPEHLSLAVSRPEELAPLCRHAGAVFVGGLSAEVFGDYGIGPNHTLPTSGQARLSGGLSVFDFLRIRTWIRLETQNQLGSLIADTDRLAQAEGLAAHALSARLRTKPVE